MKPSFSIGALALMIIFSVVSCAQPKKTAVGTNKGYATLIEATSQRTIPGIRDAEIETVYRFVIKWQSNNQPKEFFWKAPGVWQNCAVSRVRRIGSRADGTDWYRTEDINLNHVRNGDTLELIPMRGGKFPIPSSFSPKVDNAIYFKTVKSNWLHLAIDKIIKKPDIVMH